MQNSPLPELPERKQQARRKCGGPVFCGGGMRIYTFFWKTGVDKAFLCAYTKVHKIIEERETHGPETQ